MEKITNILPKVGAKRKQEMTPEQMGASMIENLLSAFNNNPRNSKVVEYVVWSIFLFNQEKLFKYNNGNL